VLDSKSTFFILQLVTNVVREWPDLRNGLNTYGSEQVLPREREAHQKFVWPKNGISYHTNKGVCHTMALPCTLKIYLKAKEELKKSG
jgi:hypothetical protein